MGELHQLRVAQVSGGAPAKVANIRTTRKNIARIYTVISQITKLKVREEYKRRKRDLLPLDLREKLTRRERLRLPNNLRFKKTNRQRQLIKKYPRRKFAVIDSSNYLPKNVRKANVKAVLSEKKTSNRYHQYLKKKQKTIKAMQTKRRQRGIKNTKPTRKYKPRQKKESNQES